jgi:lysophospholipase L1-like esterase
MSYKEALLAGISVVVTLAAGEVASRLLLAPPVRLSSARFQSPAVPKHVADADLGWTIQPHNAHYRFQASGRNGSVDVRYSIQNGHRAVASHRVPGPKLIAAGCSFTFGLGVDDDSTWPWLLQERLTGYEVVNAAISGYGTDQALLAAERVVRQSAGPVRLVALGLGDFQIERNRATQGVIYYPYPLGKPLYIADGDGLQSRGLVRFWYPGSLLERSALFMAMTNRVANLVNRVPSHDGAREVTARLIAEFSKRFAERGARLVVIMLPHAGDQAPQSKGDRAFLLERLQQAGIPVLSPDFPRLADGRLDPHRFLIPSDEVHPNREYNLLVATQTAEFLRGRPDLH